MLLAIVFVSVERVALAQARHRPDLAALAILAGQELANLANRAFIGRGPPAAVFAVLRRVEILVALTVIRAHPGAPSAFGRDQRAVFGLRFGALGRDQVQALALVAIRAPVAVATIVVIPLAIVAVSIVPVPIPVSIIPVSMIPVSPGMITPMLVPLDNVARLVGVEMVMLMLMLRALLIKVRLQIGFAAAARIGEPKAAIVLKAITSERALDVGAGIFPLGLGG